MNKNLTQVSLSPSKRIFLIHLGYFGHSNILDPALDFAWNFAVTIGMSDIDLEH